MTDALKNEIIININDSTYAHGFNAGNQIHADELKKCLGIIKRQLDGLMKPDRFQNDDIILSHNYETIGVFGERGSGKTSFMISLLKECEVKFPDVVILKMIDPTLVEHKKPMELCVLAMINNLVEELLKKTECSVSGSDHHFLRKKWDNVMRDLAIGVIAIDSVGKSYSDDLWHDEDYVVHTGYSKIGKTNDFEKNIRNMLTIALDILGKKAFVLAFDDIDVDVEQGWKVLESIRRYFSDNRIISIVSGNLKLYGMIVRNQLSQGLTIGDERRKEIMANELESQYMLKLIRPERRINLLQLKLLLRRGVNVKFFLEGTGKTPKLDVCPDDAYGKILGDFGITDSASKNTYIDFLESMSLRSQINFVKAAWENDDIESKLYVFSSRLYAAGIDWDILLQNAELTNIFILDYLLKNQNMPDSYLLLPTLPDKDINSNFVAFTFISCDNYKANPYLMFDYLLRIGYLRNLILPLTGKEKVNNLIRYAAWNQTMSLKNNIGLTMAFFSNLKGKESLNEHISLYGFECTAHKGGEETENALDRKLNELDDDFIRLLAMFPFVRILSNANNEGRNYYSFFTLLAAICEILKCDSEEAVNSAINDLKLFRTYLAPDESDTNVDEPETVLDIEIKPTSISRLAKMLCNWKVSYYKEDDKAGNVTVNSESDESHTKQNETPQTATTSSSAQTATASTPAHTASAQSDVKQRDKEIFLPPYVLGKIATRAYNAMLNVEGNSVGELFNLMVCSFINACVIEESKIKLPYEKHSELNNNNPRKDTKILIDNLKKTDIVNQLDFSKWIMQCPLINSFVDKTVFDAINECSRVKSDEYKGKVYDFLCGIKSKDKKSKEKPKDKPSKQTFSVTGRGWEKTYELLKKRASNEDIINKIIKATDKEACNFIKGLNLFKSVRTDYIKKFRAAFNLKFNADRK